MFQALGLFTPLLWYFIEIKKDRLDGSQGDVDILAGRLKWRDPQEWKTVLANEAKDKEDWHPTQVEYIAALRLAESGGLEWPPPTDYLVAVEAKCSYLDPNIRKLSNLSADDIKSRKSSWQKTKHIQQQVSDLLQMGFNKVALLDLIANPPATGTGSEPWLFASIIANAARDALDVVLNSRLPEISPAGHWVYSMGAVAGGDETMRGAGVPEELRHADENPFLSNTQVQARSQNIKNHLNAILKTLPHPYMFPVFYIDCRKCASLHWCGASCAE
jgi:hypothetical protein